MHQPASIAIIPDGNRRFAQKNALSLVDAYRAGFSKVQDVLSWTDGTSVSSVRLWALSLENFQKRSSMELRILFQLMRHQLSASLSDPRFAEQDVAVRFFGKKSLLPKSVQDGMAKLEEKTAHHQKELGVAIAYSGREELASAAQAAAEDLQAGRIDAITEKTLEPYLYSAQPVDLVIRTGDVQRLSGFLPWQNAYAEVYFSKKLWPEFDKKEFDAALDFYANTERRFGQ